MPELKSLDTVYLVLAFLVPGLIASFVRVQFTTGRLPPPTEAALGYLALTIVYYALTLSAIDYALLVQQLGY